MFTTLLSIYGLLKILLNVLIYKNDQLLTHHPVILFMMGPYLEVPYGFWKDNKKRKYLHNNNPGGCRLCNTRNTYSESNA
jgi:hypothetical protein